MAIVSESVSITTAADGTGTGYTTSTYTGYLEAIVYTPDSLPWSNNVVITVTGETSTVALWTETLATASAATTRYPRAGIHTALGVAAVYIAAGQAVLTPIPISGERIKVTLASGGNTKTSALRFIIQT